MLNALPCSLTYKPATATDETIQQNEATCTRPIASSPPTISINGRAATTAAAFRVASDLYYATVVSSPSPPLLKSKAAACSTDDEDEDDDDDDEEHLTNTRWWWRLMLLHPRLCGRPMAELLAVSAVHAISHLAYAAATPARATALQLAAAEVAGRLFAPIASDLLSPGGSTSIYLYAAVLAVGGTVLLTGAAAAADSDTDPFQWSQSSHAQWSASLVVALGLASGAAVGLEPLVAVRALGRERFATSCSATLLGKGAAQLAVDLFLQRPSTGHVKQWPPVSPCALYALGSILVATAAAWTAAFLVKHHYTDHIGCSRYVRTVWLQLQPP